MYSLPFKPAFYYAAGAAKYLSDSAAPNSAFIKTFDFLNRKINSIITFGPLFSSRNFEVSSDNVSTDAKLASDIINGNAGSVFCDNIVSIKRDFFHGFVYNIETEKSYYVANGIITHNCRSVYRAITKSWEELGLGKSEIPKAVRPFVRSTKAVKNIPKADRDLLTGRVPADTTYGPWLKAQPAAFQDEVLGVRKGKLFRQGKLDIEAFSDPVSGHEYTLAELKVREPSAWKLAFGNE